METPEVDPVASVPLALVPPTRRLPRPHPPRVGSATHSPAILTPRGLGAGYVALPLARLLAQRVWGSVERLNQQLTGLEQGSFSRMTTDRTFVAQGRELTQLLDAYATCTTALAALVQRLAQNRLTAADRVVLARGDLAALLVPLGADHTVLPDAAPAPGAADAAPSGPDGVAPTPEAALPLASPVAP